MTLQEKPLYAALHYNEISSHLILSAKESNDRAAARYLASLIAMRFNRLHRELGFTRYLLVPIPSSKKADKRRGYSHTVLLGKLVAREVQRNLALSCRVERWLSPNRSIADQSALSARERRSNIHGAFTARPEMEGEGAGIILIDDLVTTGSTMGEGIRALKMAFCEPDALLSACLAGRFLTNKIGPSLQDVGIFAKKEEPWHF